ncbi:hypothetical protein RhiirC2_110433 [Rhizophagus irregularis]|uniref:Uncharacterized protein n=1 Tax=Rhizophagus irregularis TaxID=588596 RepID=A0A2N1MRG4_9GLOM|nr:hypothetical protein RhiirC2_110433 [Rhizophagus irregularis]
MGNWEFREYGMTLRQALELEDHIKGLENKFLISLRKVTLFFVRANFGKNVTLYQKLPPNYSCLRATQYSFCRVCFGRRFGDEKDRVKM